MREPTGRGERSAARKGGQAELSPEGDIREDIVRIEAIGMCSTTDMRAASQDCLISELGVNNWLRNRRRLEQFVNHSFKHCLVADRPTI